jgi:enamine deaminase RidA (YjgF/YER057c/UK114 family)
MVRTTCLALMAALSAGLAHAQEPQIFVPEGSEGFSESFMMAPAIRAGDFVFISGVVGYIPLDTERTSEAYEAAIRDAFMRTETVLNAAGTGWADVVEMTSFHVDMRAHQEIFRSVREEFVSQAPYPAWTGIGVEQLWSDALFVEIRVKAYVGGD